MSYFLSLEITHSNYEKHDRALMKCVGWGFDQKEKEEKEKIEKIEKSEEIEIKMKLADK